MTPRVDRAGNVFVRAGSGTAPAILFGSHIDSVPSGGNFDGDLGTLAALEAMQAVQRAGVKTRHPLQMVLWGRTRKAPRSDTAPRPAASSRAI